MHFKLIFFSTILWIILKTVILMASMNEESVSFEKFSNGYKANDEEKKQYRHEIQQLIDDEKLFVAPAQPYNRGLHRSDVYSIIHPIYKSNECTETVANCFACSKCFQIFLHLRTNGTAPFKLHKCFKAHAETLKTAEILAGVATQKAEEAKADAMMANKAVENIRSKNLVEYSIEDDGDDAMGHSSKRSGMNDQIEQSDQPVTKRPRYAEVVATTIESFVDLALKGKRVKASDLIDYVPRDFTQFSW